MDESGLPLADLRSETATKEFVYKHGITAVPFRRTPPVDADIKAELVEARERRKANSEGRVFDASVMSVSSEAGGPGEDAEWSSGGSRAAVAGPALSGEGEAEESAPISTSVAASDGSPSKRKYEALDGNALAGDSTAASVFLLPPPPPKKSRKSQAGTSSSSLKKKDPRAGTRPYKAPKQVSFEQRSRVVENLTSSMLTLCAATLQPQFNAPPLTASDAPYVSNGATIGHSAALASAGAVYASSTKSAEYGNAEPGPSRLRLDSTTTRKPLASDAFSSNDSPHLASAPGLSMRTTDSSAPILLSAGTDTALPTSEVGTEDAVAENRKATGGEKRSRKNEKGSFLKLLYTIVKDKRYSGSIHWDSSGARLVVPSAPTFFREAVGPVYGHSTITTFVNQMARWGFVRIKAGTDGAAFGEGRSADYVWQHPTLTAASSREDLLATSWATPSKSKARQQAFGRPVLIDPSNSCSVPIVSPAQPLPSTTTPIAESSAGGTRTCAPMLSAEALSDPTTPARESTPADGTSSRRSLCLPPPFTYLVQELAADIDHAGPSGGAYGETELPTPPPDIMSTTPDPARRVPVNGVPLPHNSVSDAAGRFRPKERKQRRVTFMPKLWTLLQTKNKDLQWDSTGAAMVAIDTSTLYENVIKPVFGHKSLDVFKATLSQRGFRLTTSIKRHEPSAREQKHEQEHEPSAEGPPPASEMTTLDPTTTRGAPDSTVLTWTHPSLSSTSSADDFAHARKQQPTPRVKKQATLQKTASDLGKEDDSALVLAHQPVSSDDGPTGASDPERGGRARTGFSAESTMSVGPATKPTRKRRADTSSAQEWLSGDDECVSTATAGASGQGSRVRKRARRGKNFRCLTNTQFVVKLCQLASSATSNPFLQWDASGHRLLLLHEDGFVNSIAKVHLKQYNYASFSMAMKRCGFRLCSRVERKEILDAREAGATAKTRVWQHPSIHASTTEEELKQLIPDLDGEYNHNEAELPVRPARRRAARALYCAPSGEFEGDDPGATSSDSDGSQFSEGGATDRDTAPAEPEPRRRREVKKRATRKRRGGPFLSRFFALILDSASGVAKHVHWDSSGRILVVEDEAALLEQVGKPYFDYTRAATFNKRLQQFGFVPHPRSRRDLFFLSKTVSGITKRTRFYFHRTLNSASTIEELEAADTQPKEFFTQSTVPPRPPAQEEGFGGDHPATAIAEGTLKPSLLETLYRITHDTSINISQYIEWEGDGQLLKIHDVDEFVENVGKVYFEHTNFTSFRSQLHRWGFNTHTENAPSKNRGQAASSMAFSHSKFCASSTAEDIRQIEPPWSTCRLPGTGATRRQTAKMSSGETLLKRDAPSRKEKPAGSTAAGLQPELTDDSELTELSDSDNESSAADSDESFEQPRPSRSDRRGGQKSEKSSEKTFLFRLLRLLRDKPIGSSEWIRWDPSGKIIMIASETGLVKNILKEHFGQFSIDAFRKAMRKCGFVAQRRNALATRALAKAIPDFEEGNLLWTHPTITSETPLC